MKLSVFTVVTPDLTPEELAQAAKEAGIEGIEWRYKEIPAEAQEEPPSFWRRNLCSIDPRSTEEELDRFAKAASGHGLRSLSVMPYLTPGDLEGTEKAMKAAKRLGASAIRVGVPGYDRTKNYNELYEEEIAYLHGVEELARRYKVKGLVETHHRTIAPSAGLTHRLVSRFDPAAVGVLYDPGNMIHEGYENFRLGLELLGPYLAHVHVKNTGWKPESRRENGKREWSSYWEPVSGGIVDWKQVLADLAAVGYDGYLGLEDFSGTFGSRELLQVYAQDMKELLAGL
ncbi:sugar phosphate isomerase/epimerase family protein [Paenibacillus mucilaginosus]|uniref:Xylose isomerase domain-containing protein n=3 Tax=Paenibacillus mucilaginosus TaxID=61624 RepID=H6NQJ5_9BACL|nr:sugar phosphate isomerase/epimerase family protein [Paenibacillus mucilaginosus]AEI45812.1 Xylose isomerase domain protein TIM barrel [Paenibacillus mucilaginosus KNP414]AFC33463.1 xylose isomerase domain-containing protein [Paenibacillus mucilaginosus 3016]AFH65783.1 xylose isomerase [Paenibacillus mucilaginosus K02]MCG7215007.1 sugar phosphate isomerase/epimerase [Paenibacillus mucilaginosus]WDM27183.1 sugar phosphate isomerase/epimerase [Paenibacillus mucilaginosus]